MHKIYWNVLFIIFPRAIASNFWQTSLMVMDDVLPPKRLDTSSAKRRATVPSPCFPLDDNPFIPTTLQIRSVNFFYNEVVFRVKCWVYLSHIQFSSFVGIAQ